MRRLGEIDGLAEVLVIDNASTDGTGEWLAGRPHTGEVPLWLRTLTTNRGGAGGFHDGLAWALDREADLVWLMDDDGLPDPDCLERLLSRPTSSTSGARSSSTRPTPPGWSSRSASPAGPGWCTPSTTYAVPLATTASTAS